MDFRETTRFIHPHTVSAQTPMNMAIELSEFPDGRDDRVSKKIRELVLSSDAMLLTVCVI